MSTAAVARSKATMEEGYDDLRKLHCTRCTFSTMQSCVPHYRVHHPGVTPVKMIDYCWRTKEGIDLMAAQGGIDTSIIMCIYPGCTFAYSNVGPKVTQAKRVRAARHHVLHKHFGMTGVSTVHTNQRVDAYLRYAAAQGTRLWMVYTKVFKTGVHAKETT